MNIGFKKTKPQVFVEEFLLRCKKVGKFTSSTGRGYEVLKIEDQIMYFNRVHANRDIEWSMNLFEVYNAYDKLIDFSTKNFKPYVPRRQSPARGLLLHFKMIE